MHVELLYRVPIGFSDTHYEWKATIGGKLIAAAGHIHDHGINDELTNKSAGEALLCNSVAGYGGPGYETPDGRKHVSSMSVCTGNPIATVTKGQTLRLHRSTTCRKDTPLIDDAMGIAIAYFG